MGTDIRFHTEIKINGSWHHYGSPSVDRNYDFFGILAGVRGDGKLFEVKGLPTDATVVSKLGFSGGYGYSPSWLGKEEIAKVYLWWRETYKDSGILQAWIEYQVGFLFGNDWRTLPAGVEDVRWIFWFD